MLNDCPYCGKDIQDFLAGQTYHNEYEAECPECEKSINVCIDVTVDFNIAPCEEDAPQCNDCGEKMQWDHICDHYICSCDDVFRDAHGEVIE